MKKSEHDLVTLLNFVVLLCNLFIVNFFPVLFDVYGIYRVLYMLFGRIR